MGEANYYGKLAFVTEAAAEAAVEPIRKFFMEGCAAQDWWQANRHLSPAEFWPEFIAQFPLVYEYLGMTTEDDCNNSLAGLLDFPEIRDGDHGWQSGEVSEALPDNDNLWYIYFTGYSVWHFAEWGPMISFCREKWGAIGGGYVSDEYATPDYHSLIEMSW